MDRSWQPESCRAGLRRAHGRLRALPTGGAGADAASVAADRLTGDNKIAATPSDCNFGWEAQQSTGARSKASSIPSAPATTRNVRQPRRSWWLLPSASKWASTWTWTAW